MNVTLYTNASAGTLQALLLTAYGHSRSVNQGRMSSTTEVSDSRYGSLRLRATRDGLRARGHAAWIEKS